ncbi:growth factor receptor-bound protein 7-like [Corythoichthys intestinalis]|uniref:growth factor receptor-bound protein 7-like n=1 Tax=Corythoichthys intestinalis TaxID=161448 RepID=UPI0025A54425|nr:growth factor receptor-bound protein 7-like [Corythoichthys intestinalis]
MSRKQTLEEDAGEVTWPEVSRSQPISIAAGSRSKRRECLSSSAPCVPNPFPELGGPSVSPVATSTLSPPSHKWCHFEASERFGSTSPDGTDGKSLKVFDTDERARWIRVRDGATAADVCGLLASVSRRGVDRENRALLEVRPALGLERCLEDHEVVPEVEAGDRTPEADVRLVFSENYAKYQFFRQPGLFFPDAMISDSADGDKVMTSQRLVQDLVRSGSCPEIQGFLHVKESLRESWKRRHLLLRRSGLYRSSKGASKEPRHLHYVADITDHHVYNVSDARKVYAAPKRFCFAIAPSGSPVRLPHLKMFCADSERSRTCWTSAFRLFKYGKQLQMNFQQATCSRPPPDGQTNLTDGKAKSEACLVAMDFSGSAGGRVVENPADAEWCEGRPPRRHEVLLCGPPVLNSLPDAPLHEGRPWFHGDVSREQARLLMEKRGLVDGTFLIRSSRQHARCFVLSLCFRQKTKHFLVIPCEDRERRYLTMDDGVTLFADLLQLVDFHQINKGILPVCLKHPCTCDSTSIRS